MHTLLELFSTDRKLLETRGSLIIRQLCLNLNTERIYRTFAEILEKEEVSSLLCAVYFVSNIGVGSRICQRHGSETEHDLDHIARVVRVPETAEEPRDESE